MESIIIAITILAIAYVVAAVIALRATAEASRLRKEAGGLREEINRLQEEATRADQISNAAARRDKEEELAWKEAILAAFHAGRHEEALIILAGLIKAKAQDEWFVHWAKRVEEIIRLGGVGYRKEATAVYYGLGGDEERDVVYSPWFATPEEAAAAELPQNKDVYIVGEAYIKSLLVETLLGH